MDLVRSGDSPIVYAHLGLKSYIRSDHSDVFCRHLFFSTGDRKLGILCVIRLRCFFVHYFISICTRNKTVVLFQNTKGRYRLSLLCTRLEQSRSQASFSPKYVTFTPRRDIQLIVFRG